MALLLFFHGSRSAAQSQSQIKSDLDEPVRAATYDTREEARQYFDSVWSPQALGVSLVSASAGSAFRTAWTGFSEHPCCSRIGGDLARNTIAHSIEFGTSALLRRDQQFKPSGVHGFRGRAGYAAYHAFVAGEGDDQLAYSRLAAAFGTAWITDNWHPWQRAKPNPWAQASWALGRYVLRSYWVEFKPDIKREARKLFRR
ncbi:MAG: hypothetical protein JO061_10740 [Acidobacteriaceae bacterium]|nr:hypothetical protein [Acidobacteriaceae bacterium]